MNRILCVFLTLFLAAHSYGKDEGPDVLGLTVQYLNDTASGNHARALATAYKLNAIDPTDTQALLYIVLLSVKSGVAIPDWVLSEPWPNSSSADVFNRQVAERIANGT